MHKNTDRRKRHVEGRNWRGNFQEDGKSDGDEVLYSVMLQRDVLRRCFYVRAELLRRGMR